MFVIRTVYWNGTLNSANYLFSLGVAGLGLAVAGKDNLFLKYQKQDVFKTGRF